MKNFLKLSFLFISLCCAFLNTNAQQIVHLDSKNGLINGTINAFEKDSLGYVWIGTDQGINRYSGVEFKNYNLEKYSQTKDEGIVDIINLKGDLYAISSSGSLFKYHYDLDCFEKILSLQDKRFLSLAPLNNTQLLIGLSTGFIVFDTKHKKRTNIQHPNTLNNREVCFYKGKIYSASSRGLYVYKYSNEKMKLDFDKKYLENKDIINFAFDSDKRIWVGAEVGGLYVINGNEIKNIPISQISNKTYAIRKISFDKNNNALIAIDRLGLFVLNKNFEIIKSFSHDEDNINSISQNSIYEIYVDDVKAYWLGAREGGVNIIYQKDNVFTNISHIQNKVNSIQNNNVRSIFESSKGDIWFGTENGISKYDTNKNWTNYNTDPKLFNTAVLAINTYKNNLILGTYGEGLLSLNQETGAVSNLELEPKTPLDFIFSVNCFNDNLWLGGNQYTVDSSSFGAVGQVGMDYMLDKNWGLNVDVKYISMNTNVSNAATGASIGKLNLSPWTPAVGVTYKF